MTHDTLRSTTPRTITVTAAALTVAALAACAIEKPPEHEEIVEQAIPHVEIPEHFAAAPHADPSPAAPEEPATEPAPNTNSGTDPTPTPPVNVTPAEPARPVDTDEATPAPATTSGDSDAARPAEPAAPNTSNSHREPPANADADKPQHSNTNTSAASSAATPAPAPASPVIEADAGPWSQAAANRTTPDGWLDSFNDPTLNELVAEALANNLDLRAAAAQMNVAAGVAAAAGASLSPVVGAGGAASTQGGDLNNRLDRRGAGLTFNWEIDVWGRLRSAEAAAGERYEGAALDAEAARQSIAAATAKAYFLACEARQQRDLTDENATTVAEMLRVTDARREVGRASAEDARLVRAELAGARERAAAARDAHDRAVRALEGLLGRYPSAELEAAPALPAMPPPVPLGVPAEVLTRRPDVAAAERRVRGAFMDVEAEKLARLPRVALTGGGGISNGVGQLLKGGPFFNLAGNLVAPILDGGRIDAQVEIATAEQEAAVADYGRTAINAFLEVENSLSAEAALAEREAALAQAEQDLAEALRLRTIQADVGKADVLSVLQLRRDHLAARSGLITLRQARRSERVNLHLALGGDFETTTTDAAASEPGTDTQR